MACNLPGFIFMDIHAIVQIIQEHPLFKHNTDQLRQHLLRSHKQGQFLWSEFSARLKEFAPEVLFYLESKRAVYKELASQNLKRSQEGYHFVVIGSNEYPDAFYLMSDPPISFTYFGSPIWLYRKCVSIVGSRDARAESMQWIENEYSQFLVDHSAITVSGGARGVDQAAHLMAIRKHQPTVVVLPSGLGQIYPQSLSDWKKSILDVGGCFLSEYNFEQRMQKYLFHHRNRLIAAFGKVLIIVEARRRSGTMITAQLAAQWGVPVLVVPGHPSDQNFLGSLDLLSEGATLLRDAQDLGMFFESEVSAEIAGLVSVDEHMTNTH